MEKRLESIIKYLPMLNEKEYGDWVIDKDNDGTKEHPVRMSFVRYNEIVPKFVKDVSDFVDENKDFELTRYNDILQKNGIKWDKKSMKDADVSRLDAQCVMALIVAVIRADRFCDGVLLSFFNEGKIKEWVERLNEIDKLC